MFKRLLCHIQKLSRGTTFTFKDICVSCFGCPLQNAALASKVKIDAFKCNEYILISATKTGANIYRKK